LIFNIAQWLFAPYIINSIYKVREVRRGENPQLEQMMNEISMKSGIKKPKLMYSKIPIPNAFAYGSPLTGNHVALTQGLLKELDAEEVEAVIGHEIGHIKHRDVQIMMFISLLPSIFYMLSRSMLYSSYYGGRNRRDTGGLALIGGISMIIYFFLLLFTLRLSRLREYYADQHSVSTINDGARKLSEGLAKISSSILRLQRSTRGELAYSGFKTLFVSDPDRALQDTIELLKIRENRLDNELVQSIINKKITFSNQLIEVFSTHPNIVKRLRALNN
jgi:heat shock protein HtpX